MPIPAQRQIPRITNPRQRGKEIIFSYNVISGRYEGIADQYVYKWEVTQHIGKLAHGKTEEEIKIKIGS